MADDLEWMALIKKWEAGIDVESSTEEDLVEFINTKIYDYTQDRIVDENLWYGFKEDFKDFTLETFNKVGWRQAQKLRIFLRCGGVRVEQNNPRLSIARGVYNVLLEEEPYPQSAFELTQAATELKLGDITSVFITSDAKNTRPGQEASGTVTDSGTGSRSGRLPDSEGGGALSDLNLPNPLSPSPETLNITNNSQVSLNARLIREIAKIYTKEQKYDGTNSSFT